MNLPRSASSRRRERARLAVTRLMSSSLGSAAMRPCTTIVSWVSKLGFQLPTAGIAEIQIDAGEYPLMMT